MGEQDAVIEALRRAVLLAPDDATLRVHLGGLLLRAGDVDGALAEAVAALAAAPDDATARALMASVLARPAAEGTARTADPSDTVGSFDFSAAEQQFVRTGGVAEPAPSTADEADVVEAASRQPTLADVGGMARVKERLQAAFLAPLSNPELRAMFGKRLRGGLLMYGPPGCGKTFLARALAGELGASFLNIGVHDVLDPYLGASERNLHDLFQKARRAAPCVLFIDELDTLGQRRAHVRGGAMRGVVNQLLTELDGAGADNDGVFTLAATNQPWDVDPALRRPGRFDRTVLVLPPDVDAREAIFVGALAGRPVVDVDEHALAARSEGLSGADIAAVCEDAAEHALLEAVRTGIARPISAADLDAALTRARPSTSAWFDSIRNTLLYGEDDGTFTELRAHMKRIRRL